MPDNDLISLAEIRKGWVDSTLLNNFDIESILSGFYVDPSHFIYEILQNAEDAGAKEINFNLFNDKLEIIHNGEDFDFDDIDGITGIGITTKKDNLNKIGKFGVGFKSVFAITETPIIHSGNYHIRIQDFVVPYTLSKDGSVENTLITLPFNHSTRQHSEVYSLVENKLQNIGLRTLLFLTNINEIRWNTPTHSGHYYKSSEVQKKVTNTKRVSIISIMGNEELFEEYLVVQRPIEIENKELRVEVAYRIEKDKSGEENIVSISHEDSKLVVFFPTEKVTYLNFLVQGPFKTTPNRENIPLEDEQNKIIIEEIGDLVASSITVIKKLNLLNTRFLEVLPISNEHCNENIYSIIYEKVKERILSNEKLLPTIHGGYSHPSDSLLARGKDLPRLLNQKDLKILFDKTHWLNKNITYDRTRQLRDYLIDELGVREIDFERFAENISEEFIKRKNDKWLKGFYRKLLDQQSLWREGTRWQSVGILRKKHILRLKNNKHIAPYDSNGNIQVYLPTKTKSKYKIIKPSLIKNKGALKFLRGLGLKEPDIFAEIREFILPKYRENQIDINTEYYEDFEKLLIAFNKDPSDSKKTLLSELKKLRIVESFSPPTSKKYLMKPTEVYLKSYYLEEYFKSFEYAFFVSVILYKKFKNQGLEKFLLEIGCSDTPKRIEVDSDLTWEEKRQLRHNKNYSRELYIRDYIYDGLDNFLLNIDEERSSILWELLLKNLSKLNTWEKYSLFQGEYSWFYRREYSEYFPSKFLRKIKETDWIYDRNGNNKRPNELTLNNIGEKYLKDDENIEVLTSILGFQLDDIKIIEEKTGGKFIPKEEVELYEQWKSEQLKNELKESQEDEDIWIPDVEPDDTEIIVEDVETELVVSPDLRNQNIQEKNGYGNGKKRSETGELSIKSKKKIGKWGEEYVYRHLMDGYSNESNIKETVLGFISFSNNLGQIEVKWLNKNRDVGKGYDFVVIRNSVKIKYIEVKTTIGKEKELHPISGTQWEFARMLFDDGEGDKYQIYVVVNAGSNNAKIKRIINPIQLWKDGRLYAHPIHFKV